MSGTSRPSGSLNLPIAAAISLVIHLMAGFAVFGNWVSAAERAEATRDTSGSQDEERDEKKPNPPRLRLGIERSSHASVTWLGFDTPEEHQVTFQSEVEQAALAKQDSRGMQSGVPDAPGLDQPIASVTPVESRPDPSEAGAVQETAPDTANGAPPAEVAPEAPTTAADRALTPGEPAPAMPQAAPVEATKESAEAQVRNSTQDGAEETKQNPARESEAGKPAKSEAEDPEPDKVPVAQESTADAPKAEAVETPQQPEQKQDPSRAAPEQVSQESPPTVVPRPGTRPEDSQGDADRQGEGQAIRVGLRSDKESPASALKRAVKYRPGRPVAVQGLELTTVEPRWPVSVRLTTSPRNPLMVIHFDRRGIVTRVDFVKDEKRGIVYSTGEPAVDEPLRTALFQWRAKGEELTRIPADDPNATISIVMEIMLNGR
ncbi:MAG: hypothetical protein KF902_09665 [Phycisphaeraceae bacterium]|nr:hypothetical protein [Phycisphaeraceae bacterium]